MHPPFLKPDTVLAVFWDAAPLPYGISAPPGRSWGVFRPNDVNNPGGFLCEGVAKCLQWPSDPIHGRARSTQRKNCTVYQQLTPPLASVSITVAAAPNQLSAPFSPYNRSSTRCQHICLFHLGATAVASWLIPIPDTSYLATTAITEAHTIKWYVKGDGENKKVPNLRFTPTCICFLVKLQCKYLTKYYFIGLKKSVTTDRISLITNSANMAPICFSNRFLPIQGQHKNKAVLDAIFK